MKKNNRNIIMGIGISTFALLLFLSNTHTISGGIVKLTLSTLLLVYGIISLFRKNFYMGTYAILFSIKYSQDHLPMELNLYGVSYWTLFVIGTLFAYGLKLIFGSQRRSLKYYRAESTSSFSSSQEKYIYLRSNFNEETKYIYSDQIKQVDLNVNMGSISVYFQNPNLYNDLTINLDCKAGNVEIHVPREWHIVDNLNSHLSNIDFDYKEIDFYKSSPYKVYITGYVVMSNIDIIYV